jgi:protein-S-isoprenylcysteine O-methyltransferase Ste14
MGRKSCVMQAIWLALRSLLWTLLLPGFFAGYLPWTYFGVGEVDLVWTDPLQVVGVLLVVAGAALLLWCIFEFARSGRGTLSPVDPPKELVLRGLYRYVRNPMYLSVLTMVLGEILLTRSMPLLFYWLAFFTAASGFVRGYEEPTLRRQFGESYDRYVRTVPRWIPGLPSRIP